MRVIALQIPTFDRRAFHLFQKESHKERLWHQPGTIGSLMSASSWPLLMRCNLDAICLTPRDLQSPLSALHAPILSSSACMRGVLVRSRDINTLIPLLVRIAAHILCITSSALFRRECVFGVKLWENYCYNRIQKSTENQVNTKPNSKQITECKIKYFSNK